MKNFCGASFRALVSALGDIVNVDNNTRCLEIDQMLELIGHQAELRFFVDGTLNLGHQAATINLMKRVINITKFVGQIKIVYADTNREKFGSTPEKLAIMLAGLDPSNLSSAIVSYGTCKDIKFVNYQDRATLLNDAVIGFTGGADDMGINFAAELKVKYFLRLQPYLWDDDYSRKMDQYYESSRIEESTGNFFYIVDEYPQFRNLAYKIPKDSFDSDSISDEIWAWFGEDQTFDVNLRIRTNNIRNLYKAGRSNPSLCFWPIYGLQHFTASVADIVMNIIFSGFQVQQTLQKPIVAFCMSTPDKIPYFQEYLIPFGRDLAEQSYDLQNFKAALTAKYSQEKERGKAFSNVKLDAFVSQLAHDAKSWIDARSKLTFLTGFNTQTANYINIAERLTSSIASAGDNEIIMVLIGSVPVDVFNYFYVNCGIPGVFEGQNTSSLALSLGRPFIQIPREESTIQDNYPPTLDYEDYANIAFIVNNAALTLRDHGFEAYLYDGDAKVPNEYFLELSKISGFILNARDTSSEVSTYFSRLGDYFQKDIHDKFLLSLLALWTVMNFKQ